MAGKTTLKPMRALRVEDDLWEPALAKAQLEGRTLSDVIRAGLRAYVAKPVKRGR